MAATSFWEAASEKNKRQDTTLTEAKSIPGRRLSQEEVIHPTFSTVVSIRKVISVTHTFLPRYTHTQNLLSPNVFPFATFFDHQPNTPKSADTVLQTDRQIILDLHLPAIRIRNLVLLRNAPDRDQAKEGWCKHWEKSSFKIGKHIRGKREMTRAQNTTVGSEMSLLHTSCLSLNCAVRMSWRPLRAICSEIVKPSPDLLLVSRNHNQARPSCDSTHVSSIPNTPGFHTNALA